MNSNYFMTLLFSTSCFISFFHAHFARTKSSQILRLDFHMDVYYFFDLCYLSSTRFCETCRWDVPAAAVIHPHNLLLRLRFLHFSVFRLFMSSLFLWLHLLRSTQFLLYCLNVHFYFHDVYVLHLYLLDFDFTLLWFYLCLLSFGLHTALFLIEI